MKVKCILKLYSNFIQYNFNSEAQKNRLADGTDISPALFACGSRT